MRPILLANFGGPRSQEEIAPFLCELLTDRELIRTKLPTFLHHFLFRWIAKRRARTLVHDYALIGGKSPIYETTEALARLLEERLGTAVLTFHRYLRPTHAPLFKQLEEIEGPLTVFPLFPQFSYATTGSISQLFLQQLSAPTLQKLDWIYSYGGHPAFIQAWKEHLSSFLSLHQLLEEEVYFLFSAHGLPISFIQRGDPYLSECKQSVSLLLEQFPQAQGLLAFQSKFGRGKWLAPATATVVEKGAFPKGMTLVIVPIAFTSDHIETLFEIEHLYLPQLLARGIRAFRCPALELSPPWIDAIVTLLEEKQGPLNDLKNRDHGKEPPCT